MKLLFGMAAFLAAMTAAQAGDIQTLDTVPYGTPCAYPEAALAAHVEGETELSFLLGSDGRFADISIAGSSGRSDLDDAAVQCLYDGNLSDNNVDVLKSGKSILVDWKMADGSSATQAVGVARINYDACCSMNFQTLKVPMGRDLQTVLSLRIRKSGLVSDVKISESSGSADLDNVARRCASLRHYEPPLDEHGQPAEISKTTKFAWGMQPR